MDARVLVSTIAMSFLFAVHCGDLEKASLGDPLGSRAAAHQDDARDCSKQVSILLYLYYLSIPECNTTSSSKPAQCTNLTYLIANSGAICGDDELSDF
ncbi:MAG: hypothetical protein H7A21_11690 [Spirochaetales bacterium]|nr:hypothetical protein [Leptospiraceae bacterium]MCP5482089.1 hypothetical protein [Spirochaetales bacterium]MCP5484955.1 hypothetical protein [Spirochaetales bacterium]